MQVTVAQRILAGRKVDAEDVEKLVRNARLTDKVTAAQTRKRGNPCICTQNELVEIRGVEPLTFSMPFSAVAGTRENAKGQMRLCSDFSELSHLLKINEPYQSLCVH